MKVRDKAKAHYRKLAVAAYYRITRNAFIMGKADYARNYTKWFLSKYPRLEGDIKRVIR